MAGCPPTKKELTSFLLFLRYAKDVIFFIVRKTTENHSCIFTGYVDAFYAFSFAVKTRKKP